MTRLVFLGPPGVGKGTQARIIADLLNIPTISTGQIFRDNMEQNTELGKQARAYMDSGRLVPDSITDPMVENRLAQDDACEGFILDGYPRSLAQAKNLEKVCSAAKGTIGIAVDINAPRDVLVQHMLNRALQENRADDNPEIFANRLDDYAMKTAPVTNYYRDRGILLSIDGIGSISEVTERIVAGLRSIGIEI